MLSLPEPDHTHSLIHDYYNVGPVPFRLEKDGSIPRTVEMPLLRRADSRPTHALAILSNLGRPASPGHTLAVPSEPPTSPLPPPSPSTPSSPYSPVHAEPFVLPIDAPLFCAKFGHNVARSLAAGLLIRAANPLVSRDRLTGAQLLTLPLIPLYVPHPPSVPHLLLYGQGLPLTPTRQRDPPNYSRPTTTRPPASPSPSTLATYLLPIPAIEEFPSAPAMAEAMVRCCSEEALRDHIVFNQGLWRNVLFLAPTDASLVDLARVAWNVTAEARKIRDRQRIAAALICPPRSPARGETELPAVSVQYAEMTRTRGRSDTVHLLPVPPSRRPTHRRSQKNLRA